MHRIYYPALDLNQNTIIISDPDEIYHASHVLRAKPNDCLRIFNGQGLECEAQVKTIDKKEMVFMSPRLLREEKQTRMPITLACSIPKNAKFDWIVEKCTELGVDYIIPLKTQRTEVIYQHAKQENKKERFEKIILNAARQSQRLYLPTIVGQMDFKDFVASSDQALKFIPYLEEQTQQLSQCLLNNKNIKSISICIGPEGDFTPEEVEQAKQGGFIPVSLGKNTLKVDTAALYVVSLAQALLD